MEKKIIKEPTTFLQEFINSLKSKINGKELLIDFHKIVKANDVSYHAIILRKGEKDTIGKCFSAEELHREHLAGTLIDELVERVLEVAGQDMDGQREGENIGKMLSDYDNVKEDRLIIKLLNPEKNKEYLKQICHVPYLNLAAAFYVLYSKTEDNMGTIGITAPMLEMWEVTEEKLFEDAVKSMEKQFPAKVYSILDVLERLIKRKTGDDFSKYMNQPESKEMEEIVHETEMFALTNDAEIGGASSILYSGILKNFAKKRGVTEVAILPSSVDELILVPDRNDTKQHREEMLGVIADVNATLEPGKVLSDSLYIYHAKEDKISVWEGREDDERD